ncbi:MAG TPA: Fe-Mn family superoxide dismutase [Candidatus Binatia bacterium]|jgi:hypothetical protein|nr:Fe-Mn family superoxide dismutase [Candidatus Binatia bacterium]
MVALLHEYYLENLAPNGKGAPSKETKDTVEKSFGTFETWRADFAAVDGMRGVGWAILYQDPVTQQLSNHWISLHHIGVPSGFKPILVMDVWSTHTCWTINQASEAATLKRSSPTLTGTLFSGGLPALLLFGLRLKSPWGPGTQSLTHFWRNYFEARALDRF